MAWPPGIFSFPNPDSPASGTVGHDRFYDVSISHFGDGNWHQVKHLLQWNTQTYIRVYFDNRLVADTNPPGQYHAPNGGFTEGPWGNLPAGDQNR